MSEGVKYVQEVKGFWSLARRYAFDALIVLLTVEAMFEVAFRRSLPDAPQTTPWFGVPAIAVLVLPLFARRRFPFAASAAFWLLAVGLSFVDGHLVTFVTSIFVIGMAASFLLGNQRAAVAAQTGLAVAVGGAAIVVYDKPAHSVSELVFIPLLFGICWLAGFAVRERAEQAQAAEVRATHAERERDAATRIAVAEERARIARELHGRTALVEMRRLLAAMRRDGDDVDLMPRPGLESLGSLLEEIGRAGLPVRLHVDGEPFPLPAALDLSAYRIVQEGLTNALKHARASHADVTVCYGSDSLQTEVRDDGIGAAASDGLGHGLVGIRERVKIYGGEMTAGTANGGGFILSTRLPLSGDLR